MFADINKKEIVLVISIGNLLQSFFFGVGIIVFLFWNSIVTIIFFSG